MFIDSFALIEYFMGAEKGRRVKEIIDSNIVAYTSPTVIAELYSKSLRTDGKEKAEERTDFILDRCVLITAGERTALRAGEIHGKMEPQIKDFGLADAFVLSAARSRGAKILTGDPDFKQLEDVVFLD